MIILLTTNTAWAAVSRGGEMPDNESTIWQQPVVWVLMLLVVLVVALLFFQRKKCRQLQKMRELRDKALENDRMKTTFISNIGHEIRTPLNTISGFMQVMSDMKMEIGSEEQRNITKIVLNNVNQITALLDELEELSLYDTARMADMNDMVSPVAMGRQAVADIMRMVPEDVHVSFSSSVGEDYTIQTNQSFVRKILNALVDNAVKNTTQGYVKISFKQGNSSYIFVVEDTGCGIPAGDAEHIFERFVKLDIYKDGIGLGLPLARSLAQRMRGHVMLDTTYDKGARFVLELPFP